MIDVLCSEFGKTIEDYDVFESIGKGGFGTVFQARCQNTGKDVAIKKIAKHTLKNERYTNRVREEVKIHSTLNNESILKLYTFFEDDDFVYLVLELCPNGNLEQKLKQMGGSFKEEEAAKYLGQVVDGLVYLHSRGIMHRDLNPRNLLLSVKGKIKIADFGLAAKIKKPDEKHMTFCGTPNYISPEMASKQSYGLEADVWNIGCLLHTMLFGHPPRKDVKYMHLDCLSPNAKDLISQCLEENVNKRIKLFDILRHKFFTSYVEGRDPISRRSDSGVYTQSTNTASMQHPRVPLSAVCEESEGIYSQDNVRSNRARRPSHSPPVKLEANRRDKYCNTPSSPSAKSTKSTSSGRSRSTEVLKDIAPIHRSPSPPLAPPPLHPCPSPHDLIPPPHYTLPQHPPSPHPYPHHPPSPHLHPQSQPHPLHPPSPRVPLSPHPHHPPSPHLHPQSQPHPRHPPSPRVPTSPHNHPENIRKQNSNNRSTNCTKKKTLQDICPPLSLTRLKDFKFQSDIVVFTIIDGKEICAEFLDKKRKKIKCIDTLCRISKDGNKIIIYHPKPGTPLLDKPLTINNDDAYDVYNYDNLPDTYWKKYAYIGRFVNLVKKNTVKISYSSDKAKCYLMENSPDADFKAVFTSGETLLFSDKKLFIGKGITYDLGSKDFQRDKLFQSKYQHLYEYSLKIRNAVLKVEQSLMEIETLTGVSFFPITKKHLGSSLPSERQKHQHSENDKENISPISTQSIPSRTNGIARQLGTYESSAFSNASTINRQRKLPTPYQQINNNNNMKNESCEKRLDCGTFYKDDRVLQLKFFDGTSLECEQTEPSLLIYRDPSGKKNTYHKNSIPVSLESKRHQFNAVISGSKPALAPSSATGHNMYRRPVINGRSSQLPKCLR
ncbi:Serine/threonine-protein kinase PLK4 [Armadillidium nasatum]|uniref:Serine/threonine-protein kinase SAK n=1 Tax=Armadillidium nasatum TaxID=96803 RepID=A0A5N5SNZ4_9CRUS|nr:Serine/threonine-protein kinase PLK4 [Armadillidium nasatum]